jgi:hypothetical protein
MKKVNFLFVYDGAYSLDSVGGDVVTVVREISYQ